MVMTRANARRHARTKANRFRAGYSFTEVMFAVVVLGIGFIMIAAMFPVAIQQSKATQEETNAAAIARGAVSYIDSIAFTRYDAGGLPTLGQNMPPTEATALATPAPVQPFDRIGTLATAGAPAGHGWRVITNGQLINANDRRYAFVPFYSREFDAKHAQVIIIVTQVRARSQYDSTDYTPGTGNPRPNLLPRPVEIEITDGVGNTQTDWITFDGAGADAIAEGTYVVVSNSPADAPVPAGAFNGRIYRVGLRATVTDGIDPPDPLNTWELQPGNDFTPLPAGVPGPVGDWDMPANTQAWVVGREYDLETTTAGDFRGLAQDIAVYSSFIAVR